MMMHLRGIAPRATTVDYEARTVEAIASTFADVQRGGYIERLARDGMDPARLIGSPVLDGHRNATTRDQLGVIEAAELRPEGLWVRIKLRSTTAAQAILTDIAEGTLRGLSIGCDDDEIMSYSGHSTKAMVQKYAGEARQEMRARQAAEKRSRP